MKWQTIAIIGGAVLVLLTLLLVIIIAVKKRKKKAKQVKKTTVENVKPPEEKPKETSKVSFERPGEKSKSPIIEKYQPEEVKPPETSFEEDDYKLYKKESNGGELPPSFEYDEFEDDPFQPPTFDDNVDPRAFAQRGFRDPRTQNSFGSYNPSFNARKPRPTPANNDDFDDEFENFRNQHCYSKFLIDKDLLDQIDGLPDGLKNIVFSDVFKKKDFDDINFGD